MKPTNAICSLIVLSLFASCSNRLSEAEEIGLNGDVKQITSYFYEADWNGDEWEKYAQAECDTLIQYFNEDGGIDSTIFIAIATNKRYQTYPVKDEKYIKKQLINGRVSEYYFEEWKDDKLKTIGRDSNNKKTFEGISTFENGRIIKSKYKSKYGGGKWQKSTTLYERNEQGLTIEREYTSRDFNFNTEFEYEDYDDEGNPLTKIQINDNKYQDHEARIEKRTIEYWD